MRKILMVLLCVALIFGVSGCVDTTHLPDVENETNSAYGEELPIPYREIVNTYTELLLCKKNGSAFPEVGEKDAAFEVLYGIAENCDDPMQMGYSTKDLNRDGIKELILLKKDCTLYAVLTLAEEQPVLLIDLKSRGVIDEDGMIYYTASTENEGKIIAQKIVDGRLVGLEYGWIKDATVEAGGICYKIVNGERTEITGAEKSQLDEKYSTVFFNAMLTTKNADLRFIPAIEDAFAKEENIPVADCSSYEAILEMYKRIVGVYRNYDRTEWVKGAYDELYHFEDDTSYEIFNSILYSGSLFRPTKSIIDTSYAENGDSAYGYAKKDVNGDGTEELILMTDQFDIRAIFTMRNGSVAMLDHYYGNKQCWFGNDGVLRVEWNSKDITEIGFMVYSITEQTTLKQEMHVVYAPSDEGDHSYAYYTVENGVRTKISNEEGQALRNQYEVNDDLGQIWEYTKTYAGLQFCPLFGAVKPDASYVNKEYVRNGYIGDKDVTLLSVGVNEVAFSMNYLKFDEDMNLVYETVITATATLNGDKYSFDNGVVRGEISFGVQSIWVTLLESEEAYIDCYAYFYTCSEED